MSAANDNREHLVPRLFTHARRLEEIGYTNAAHDLEIAANEIAFLRYELALKNKETHQ